MTRVCALAVLVIAVSCTGATTATPTATASASPTAGAAAVNAPGTRDFVLKEQLASGARGTVRVEISESGYTFTVVSMGLIPSTGGYFLNMHAGSCAREDTGVIVDLGRFGTDATGSGTFRLNFPGRYLIPPDGRILTLHGRTNTPDAFNHIACADLTS